MEIKIDTTALVAWYGAIIATISIVIEAISVIRDKAKIKLKIENNQKIIGKNGSWPYKENTDYTSISVINFGRRNVIIDIIGAWYTDDSGIIAVDIINSGPRELPEGKRINSLIEQNKIDFKKVLFFYAKDATGKKYKKYYGNRFKILIFLFNKLKNKINGQYN